MFNIRKTRIRMNQKVNVTLEWNGCRLFTSWPELPQCKAEINSIENTSVKMRKNIIKSLQSLKRKEKMRR